MFKFSKRSKSRLSTCDERLQIICNELILRMDVTILCGHRGEKEQNKAYNNGFSKLKFPHSKHNQFPSKAVDVAPYPVDWKNIRRFNEMCDIIQEIADQYNIKIKLGRDFNSFKDYPHVELQDEY